MVCQLFLSGSAYIALSVVLFVQLGVVVGSKIRFEVTAAIVSDEATAASNHIPMGHM